MASFAAAFAKAKASKATVQPAAVAPPVANVVFLELRQKEGCDSGRALLLVCIQTARCSFLYNALNFVFELSRRDCGVAEECRCSEEDLFGDANGEGGRWQSEVLFASRCDQDFAYCRCAYSVRVLFSLFFFCTIFDLAVAAVGGCCGGGSSRAVILSALVGGASGIGGCCSCMIV